MIAQNQNILLDSSINRLVQHNPADRQITFLDSRFYERNGEYYPSVTYILSFIPKGSFFIDWIREKGDDSERIVREAGERGKQVHGAIESLLRGEELNWIKSDGSARYSLEVWQMLLRFREFWTIHQPKLIGSEIHVFSDKYKFAGTIDLIVEMFGEKWILDIKTSNQIVSAYNYQLAAYNIGFNEIFDTPATRRGILWLKSHTRKEDKTGKKVQGKNWQLIDCSDNLERDFKSFELFYDVFKHESPVDKPYSEIFPTSIKL